MFQFRYSLVFLILCLSGTPCLAQAPQLQRPLPDLRIDQLGEVVLEGDEFAYLPWRSANHPGKVHIIQLINGTMRDSKLFEPFTDRLQEVFEPDNYHITSIINLDAALWGTTGFVVSEVKKSKRKYPRSTLVLDEEGVGAIEWELGKKGAALLIVDRQGVVQYFTRDAMSSEEIEAGVGLVGSHIES